MVLDHADGIDAQAGIRVVVDGGEEQIAHALVVERSGNALAGNVIEGDADAAVGIALDGANVDEAGLLRTGAEEARKRSGRDFSS